MKLQTILALGAVAGMLATPAFAEHEGKGKFHSTKSCRVSEFMGTSVVDQNGQQIGQIKDIVLQPQTGKAELAIISLSLPNQMDKLTAVPWRLLRPASEANKVMLTTDREKLMSATTFETSRWPEFDATYNQRVYAHYGLTYPAAVGAGAQFEGEYRGDAKGPAVTTKENEGFRRPQPDGRDTFPELKKDPEKDK
jgi:sporulation protein YlmC with PRC-barrel domain